jgi:hypothetical protein
MIAQCQTTVGRRKRFSITNVPTLTDSLANLTPEQSSHLQNQERGDCTQPSPRSEMQSLVACSRYRSWFCNEWLPLRSLDLAVLGLGKSR